MTRDARERIVDVERLLSAARAVHGGRATLAPRIARFTGLSPEGVELGFESLEREATQDELRALVASAGHAEHVHVILSANVFTAPLRALAIARAAADRVTVRASTREPELARALVDAADDAAISLVDERDAGAIAADEVHVYGRDATIASVRASARGTVVAHGPGMGVAVITAAADPMAAAGALAADVVPFDQRGCLSPRIAVVEGDPERALSFARRLDDALAGWGERVPRGSFRPEESEENVRWRETMAFAARLWEGAGHTVALVPSDSPLCIPPPGRHVLVLHESTLDACAARLAPVARFVVTVGTDDPHAVERVAPAHSRVTRLGTMQHPPLDGPVDRRRVDEFDRKIREPSPE